MVTLLTPVGILKLSTEDKFLVQEVVEKICIIGNRVCVKVDKKSIIPLALYLYNKHNATNFMDGIEFIHRNEDFSDFSKSNLIYSTVNTDSAFIKLKQGVYSLYLNYAKETKFIGNYSSELEAKVAFNTYLFNNNMHIKPYTLGIPLEEFLEVMKKVEKAKTENHLVKAYKRRNSCSPYYGVGKKLVNNNYRWYAQISIYKKIVHIGYFSSEEEAAQAFNEVVRYINTHLGMEYKQNVVTESNYMVADLEKVIERIEKVKRLENKG
ncbi:hypothetical protein D3C81_10510 [compost metagenome]